MERACRRPNSLQDSRPLPVQRCRIMTPSNTQLPSLVRSQSALFLDVDGTLIDLAPTPDAVTVPADLVPDLSRLVRSLGGALAILSGRTLSDIDRLLSPLRTVAAGQHGAELRTLSKDGAFQYSLVDISVPSEWEVQLSDLARAHAGVVVEHKGNSVAVHFRNAPEAAAAVEETVRRFAVADRRFMLQRGNCVVELKPRSSDKGAALLQLMRLPAFRSRTPIMIGDDLTDEDAFLAASLLGGEGLRVGPPHHRAERGFARPADVRRWLKAWASAL
jgi:trehalose 6-phosphate phosphatase